MGKKSKSQSQSATESQSAAAPSTSLPFLAGKASVDTTVASLFEKSAGPVQAPSILTTSASKRKEEEPESQDEQAEDQDEESDAAQDDGSADEDEEMQEAPSEDEVETSEAPSRKRKRGTATDDLEESYMRRLAKEEQKANDKRREEKAKRQKQDKEESEGESEEEKDEDESASGEEGDPPVLRHEIQTGGDAESQEIEKSNRTVFLGNVSSKAIKSHSAKKTLTKHLESFLSSLPESTGPHKVESIRFRSTAFASGGKIPKRAAFARRELLDETTPSTNAYVVYSTVQAARKAPAALNGTVVLDRHLRVDNVAHPAATDHKRCVFVGNLDFVDKETDPEDEENKKKKNREPADVEEGLWRTFNQHTGKSSANKNTRGNVESVRVVRDSITRVGKGFAYVQFYDQNCVEEALLLEGKKFPPLLPRKLRVSRAKKVVKKREPPSNEKLAESRKTLQGRAGKLLGKAGEAQMRAKDKGSIAQNSLVFEGHRATEGARIKVKTKSRGQKAKKNNRSSQRAAAYKAAGGKKK
ncbi:Nucleolar protein 12 [Aspergillus cristatus]|uniref:Nucleolar protein 12 n=1 Tax=Aspergillus cristatus TaxID=573508 RepID=A0A1E3BG28_ASPCR|nr:Nucleolar protein 12 [Aspergillus cristatus]